MEVESYLLWGFVVLLLLVFATVGGLLVHAGLLVAVDIKTCKPEIGEVHIAYKFAKGPYNESGSLFTQVHTLLPQYRTVGVYYDDPRQRPAQQLRYIVGLVLAEGGEEPNAADVKLLQENGYLFASFPSVAHAVQTKFPFTSTISIILAVMKVYPALKEYIEERSLCARPFLEIYDNKKSEILFIGPLEKQDDFMVPEVLEDENEKQPGEDTDDDQRTEASCVTWDESCARDNNDSECSESILDDDSPSGNCSPLEEVSASDVQNKNFDCTQGKDKSTANVTQNQTVVVGNNESEESDANTGSSFEEIDEKDAATTSKNSRESSKDVER